MPKIKRKSVVFTWAVSYLTVIIIPIVTLIITYSITEQLCVKLTNRYNQEILHSKKNEIDKVLNEASSVATELFYNEKVEEFAKFDKVETKEELYKLYELSSEWKPYYSSRNSIHNAYLYFPKSDYICGVLTSAKKDKFFMSNYNFTGYEEWNEIVSNPSAGTISSIKGIDNSIFFVKSIYSMGINDLNANVIIEVKYDSLISSQKEDTDLHALIITDKDFNVILDKRKDKQKYPLSKDELNSITERKSAKINNINYVVSVLPSSLTDWQYMYFTDAKLYSKEISDIRNIMFVSIFLCLLVSGFLILYWIKKNHMPVRKIMDSIVLCTNKKSEFYDEYKYIDKTIMETFKQKTDIESQLYRNQEILKEYQITKLFNNKNTDQTEHILSEIGVNFKGNYFAVVLFNVDSVEGMFYEESNEISDYELAEIIISNIVSEMFQKQFDCLWFTENDKSGFIVNFTDKQNAYEIMLQILSEADAFIYTAFKLNYTAVVSNINNNVNSIRKCYNEAVIAMEYKFIQMENNIVEYRLVESDSDFNYYYPIEQEQALINNLKTGDTFKCQEIVNQIWGKNLNKENFNIAVGKCLIYDVLSTIVKTVDSICTVYNLSDWQNKKVFEIIEKYEKIPEKTEAINKIINDFCEYLNANVDFSFHDVAADVNKYVNDNYFDKNLNVATVADKFNLNPNYLSSVYKKQTGISLLEYITKVRIAAAKKSLSMDKTIEAIADEVGYGSSRTFIRCFVKIEGVTPGKYRKQIT